MADNFEFFKGRSLSPEVVEGALHEMFGQDLAQRVLGRIIAKTGETQENDQVKLVKLKVANLGIAAHLNCSDQEWPTMLDAVSWERFTRDASYDVLDEARTYRGIIPEAALRFAACYASFRTLFDGSSPEEAEEILENTGYTLDRVYEVFVDLFTALASGAGQETSGEDVVNAIPNVEALAEIDWPSEAFTLLEKEMRKELAGKGYKLPELSEDGSYGLEQGKDGSYVGDFSTPRPDDTMIPE